MIDVCNTEDFNGAAYLGGIVDIRGILKYLPKHIFLACYKLA